MLKLIIGVMAIGLAFGPALVANAEEKIAQPMPFVVYLDKDAKNHYVPSGWIGDYGDLTISDSMNNPHEGRTCIKWVYSAKKLQGQGWAGCYWQEHLDNWGDKKGGYNLTLAKRLTFYARGEKGGEVVTFLMGGITSGKVSSDTCAGKMENVILTKGWKKYSISLEKKDLKNIITGFGFVITEGRNPGGCAFYLDEIVYEK